jgi:predicted nucleotide-binding protein
MQTLTLLKKDELTNRIRDKRQEEWDSFAASWAKKGFPLPNGSLISGILDIGFRSVERLIDDLFETEGTVLSKQNPIDSQYFEKLAEEFRYAAKQEIDIIRSRALEVSGISRDSANDIITTVGHKESSIGDSINRRVQILKEELGLGIFKPTTGPATHVLGDVETNTGRVFGMPRQSKLMGNALRILGFLVENNILAGRGMTLNKLIQSTGIPEEEFDSADIYLLQQKYIEGTMGGKQGSRWVTGHGIEFYENKTGSAKRHKTDDVTMTVPDPRRVFVVHGRDERLRRDFFSFLRALGLQPIEWSEALKLTGKTSPYIGEILDSAFNNAQAILVLLSPDDEVRLNQELWSANEEVQEKEFRLQARPNVLFEAGMAFGKNPNRTLLIEVGNVKPFSDVAGRHVVRLTNDPERGKEVAEKLGTAGCAVVTTGNDWLREGDFSVKRADLTPYP